MKPITFMDAKRNVIFEVDGKIKICLKCSSCGYRIPAFPFWCVNSQSEHYGDTRYVDEGCEI